MIKFKKTQWEVESMFDETFEKFITELKKGELTENLKSTFHKSISEDGAVTHDLGHADLYATGIHVLWVFPKFVGSDVLKAV
jgi:hypothetical protein